MGIQTILLILALLVASGCAVSSQQLLGSPNFVAEYLPRLLSLEKEADSILEQLKTLPFLGINMEDQVDEMQNHFDTYWVYYHAANVYLSGGNQDLYVQAVARAEHALQRINDIITKALHGSYAPKPETKPETLSL